MSDRDPQQLYIDQRHPDGMKCTLCGQQEWFWPPDDPRALEGLEDPFDEESPVPALPVGFYMFICGKCGHIVLIHEQAVDGANAVPPP